MIMATKNRVLIGCKWILIGFLFEHSLQVALQKPRLSS